MLESFERCGGRFKCSGCWLVFVCVEIPYNLVSECCSKSDIDFGYRALHKACPRQPILYASMRTTISATPNFYFWQPSHCQTPSTFSSLNGRHLARRVNIPPSSSTLDCRHLKTSAPIESASSCGSKRLTTSLSELPLVLTGLPTHVVPQATAFLPPAPRQPLPASSSVQFLHKYEALDCLQQSRRIRRSRVLWPVSWRRWSSHDQNTRPLWFVPPNPSPPPPPAPLRRSPQNAAAAASSAPSHTQDRCVADASTWQTFVQASPAVKLLRDRLQKGQQVNSEISDWIQVNGRLMWLLPSLEGGAG